MRVADKMQFNQVNQNISKNRYEMADLQNQAATQKRINKPSDDPLGSARVLAARTEERGNTQFIKNINNAKSFLEFTDQSLGELTDILVRAKELAVGQSSDAGANSQSRMVTAAEIEQIYNQSIQIGNRKLGERHIFGGFHTQTTPFDQNGEYSGDNGDMKIQIHKGSFVSMNMPGSRVFLGKGLGGDGVARAFQDTAMTVDDLKEQRENEQQQEEIEKEKDYNHVETRGPAGAFQSKSHRAKEEDPVTPENGTNVFKVLKDLEVSLRTNDKEGVQESLNFLDQAISQVILARSQVGSRISTINNTQDTLQKATVDSKITASQLEDADVFQVVSDINKAETALKATLETSGKMIQPSLLDFLR